MKTNTLIKSVIFATLFTFNAMAQLPLVNGWTQFTPSTDSRIIYVSDVDGNDNTAQIYNSASPQVGANPFLPTGNILPFKTIAAAVANQRNGFPDWVLLKNGDSFINQNLGNRTMNGRSRTEPMIFGAYGNSPHRPRVLTGGNDFVNLQGSSASFLVFLGIYAEPHTRTTSDPIGIGVVVPYNSILIEDCHFSKYFDHLVSHEYPDDPNNVLQSNLKIRRSILSYAYKVGQSGHANACFIASVDTLLFEDCLLDHNGWNDSIQGADPNTFRHNSYIYPSCQNVTFVNNIVSRSSCTGAGTRGGGYLYNNLFLSNPVNLQFGTEENTINWPTQFASGEVSYNVILDSRYESYVPGWGIQVAKTKNTNVHHNIIAHLNAVTTNAVGILLNNIQNVSVSNNIIYKWGNNGTGNYFSSGIKVNPNLLGTNYISNNDVQMENTYGECVLNYYTGNSLFFSNNRYNNAMQSNFWFNPGGTFAGWVNATGETGGTVTNVPYNDPERNISSYLATLNLSGGLVDFILLRRAMTKATWDTNFTANTVNNYIREGFLETTSSSYQFLNSMSNVTCFPNPSSGNIYIQATSKIINVKMYNALGNEILPVDIKIDGMNAELSTKSYSSGIYFIFINTDNETCSQKIILQND